MRPKSKKGTKSSKSVKRGGEKSTRKSSPDTGKDVELSPQIQNNVKRNIILTELRRGFIWRELESWPTPMQVLGSICIWLIPVFILYVCIMAIARPGYFDINHKIGAFLQWVGFIDIQPPAANDEPASTADSTPSEPAKNNQEASFVFDGTLFQYLFGMWCFSMTVFTKKFNLSIKMHVLMAIFVTVFFLVVYFKIYRAQLLLVAFVGIMCGLVVLIAFDIILQIRKMLSNRDAKRLEINKTVKGKLEVVNTALDLADMKDTIAESKDPKILDDLIHKVQSLEKKLDEYKRNPREFQDIMEEVGKLQEKNETLSRDFNDKIAKLKEAQRHELREFRMGFVEEKQREMKALLSKMEKVSQDFDQRATLSLDETLKNGYKQAEQSIKLFESTLNEKHSRLVKRLADTQDAVRKTEIERSAIEGAFERFNYKYQQLKLHESEMSDSSLKRLSDMEKQIEQFSEIRKRLDSTDDLVKKSSTDIEDMRAWSRDVDQNLESIKTVEIRGLKGELKTEIKAGLDAYRKAIGGVKTSIGKLEDGIKKDFANISESAAKTEEAISARFEKLKIEQGEALNVVDKRLMDGLSGVMEQVQQTVTKDTLEERILELQKTHNTALISGDSRKIEDSEKRLMGIIGSVKQDTVQMVSDLEKRTAISLENVKAINQQDLSVLVARIDTFAGNVEGEINIIKADIKQQIQNVETRLEQQNSVGETRRLSNELADLKNKLESTMDTETGLEDLRLRIGNLENITDRDIETKLQEMNDGIRLLEFRMDKMPASLEELKSDMMSRYSKLTGEFEAMKNEIESRLVDRDMEAIEKQTTIETAQDSMRNTIGELQNQIENFKLHFNEDKQVIWDKLNNTLNELKVVENNSVTLNSELNRLMDEKRQKRTTELDWREDLEKRLEQTQNAIEANTQMFNDLQNKAVQNFKFAIGDGDKGLQHYITSSKISNKRRRLDDLVEAFDTTISTDTSKIAEFGEDVRMK